MQANIISLVRIALVFLAIWFLTQGFYYNIAGVFPTIIAIYMDSLDGYIARKLGISSDFGALLDIAGDRIVENSYWIFYAWVVLISFWAPLIVLTRGFMTDLIRAVAFADGKTPFGKKSHLKSKTARFICASRFSRAVYGAAKVIAFIWLALYMTLKSGIEKYNWNIPQGYLDMAYDIGIALVYITVIMCVVRGVPVLWESRRLLLAQNYRWKE